MTKRIGKVEAYYIESNASKMTAVEIAKDIGCKPEQVARYLKKLTAANPDAEIVPATQEEIKQPKKVSAKGPAPFTSDNGVTVMTPAAAIHADRVEEMFKNKEWAESVKKCVHNCNK